MEESLPCVIQPDAFDKSDILSKSLKDDSHPCVMFTDSETNAEISDMESRPPYIQPETDTETTNIVLLPDSQIRMFLDDESDLSKSLRDDSGIHGDFLSVISTDSENDIAENDSEYKTTDDSENDVAESDGEYKPTEDSENDVADSDSEYKQTEETKEICAQEERCKLRRQKNVQDRRDKRTPAVSSQKDSAEKRRLK